VNVIELEPGRANGLQAKTLLNTGWKAELINVAILWDDRTLGVKGLSSSEIASFWRNECRFRIFKSRRV